MGTVQLFQKEYIRILIVEDSALDAILLKHMLEGASSEYNFNVTISTTLNDSFARIDRSNYDVALLDLGLPDMSGIASLSALHSYAPDMPIIIYSGRDDPTLLEEAKEIGAKDYIVKGRTSHGIQTAIEKVISETHPSGKRN
jgi:DNA-binding NarL/FixJ family response regulator